MEESDSGGTVPKGQLVSSLLCGQKKSSFQSWFQILLVLVVVLVFCYALSDSSLSWTQFYERYQSFIGGPNEVNSHPGHPAHPKYRDRLRHVLNSTEGIQDMPPNTTKYHQAYAPNYHFIMDNQDVCKMLTPFLVLLVPVAPHDVAARDAIRQTWANRTVVQAEVVITLFMLGLPGGDDVEQVQETLKQENLKHHDLIQSNFMDTYLNLTIKTMVIMLQKPGIPTEKYLTGMLMWDRPVVRSKDSKWYVPEEMYPDPTYPTYCLGMGYLFSNDLPAQFVEVSKTIKPFNIEDAYIGMCMKKLGLQPTLPPDASQFKAYNWKYDRCEYSKIITYILASPEQLVEYWTDLKKPGDPC